MINHINSTARPSLKGETPTRLAMQHFGKDTVEKLGLEIGYYNTKIFVPKKGI